MRNIKSFYIVIVLTVFSLIVSCGSNNRLQEVDISNAKVELTLNRFEQAFFKADKYKLKELNQSWIKQYGVLYESFMYQMLNEGSVHEPMIVYRLERFLNDSAMQDVYKQINNKFGDFSTYKTKLDEAFSYYRYYFPDSTIPSVTTFYSNFNAKVFPLPNQLGIGLDMYMGGDSKLINSLPPEIFPMYFKKKMEDKYLVADAMKYWLYACFSQPKDFRNYSIYTIKDDFLETIIHHGKMIYALEAMMPYESPELKFGYSKEQLEWCKQNEHFIYQQLVEQSLIYTKKHKDISRYINDGPFTSGLTEESPSMVGVYMGYSIVKQYMDKHPEVSLQDLLFKETNAKRLLKGYKS